MNNVRAFPSLPQSEKTRIMDLLRSPETARAYYVDSLIVELGKHITPYEFFEIGINYIKHGTPYTESRAVSDIIDRLVAHDSVTTKQTMLQSKSKSIVKLLLTIDSISIEEETLGLRAVSASKYTPEAIHKNKYRPSLEALGKLPPVMRLKTLEALTNSRKVKYSMFENIEEDDFKALLFTSSMKHTDRVRFISNKYNELKYMGQKATIKISGNCNICGDYSITVTSGVVRTITGLQESSGIKILAKQYCPFCYSHTTNLPNIEKV